MKSPSTPLLVPLLFGFMPLLATDSTRAANGTWSLDGNGLWSDSANWSSATVADGSGFTADFGSIDITGDRTVTLDSARVIGNLTFGDSNTATGAGWILGNDANPANTLTLDGTTPIITVNTMAPVDVFSAKSALITCVVQGTSGLKKDGAGRLKLTGSNLYSGGTVVDGGTLAIINDSNLGSYPGAFDATNITLMNGATLDATATLDAYNAGNNVDLGANRGIYLGAGVQRIMKNHRGINLYVRGVISGPGSLNMHEPTTGDDGGGSRSHLYGANTFTGETTITHSGIKDPGLVLHNPLSLQNSTLNYNVSASDTTLLWFDGGATNYTTGYTLGGLKGSKNLNLSPQGNTAKNLKIGNNNQDTTYDGIISSSNDALAGITKIGSGKLTLTKACTYAGPTSVDSGILALGANGSFSNSSSVTLKPGGILDTTAKASYVIPAGKTYFFQLDGSGSGSSGRISAATLDISSATVVFTELSSLNDAAYVLASYSGLVGGSFLSATPPAGYNIDYAYNGGTQIALVSTTTSGYPLWISTNYPGIPDADNDPDDDPDGDGLDNGIEYVLNSSPIVATPSPLVPAITGAPGSQNFVATFERYIPSKADTELVMDWGTNLVWDESPAVGIDTATSGPNVTVTPHIPASDYETVRLTLPLGTDPRKFARLRVIVVP